jgi:hypothetical protein
MEVDYLVVDYLSGNHPVVFIKKIRYIFKYFDWKKLIKYRKVLFCNYLLKKFLFAHTHAHTHTHMHTHPNTSSCTNTRTHILYALIHPHPHPHPHTHANKQTQSHTLNPKKNIFAFCLKKLAKILINLCCIVVLFRSLSKKYNNNNISVA